MLRILDKNKVPVKGLRKYSDLCIENSIELDDKTLTFSVPYRNVRSAIESVSRLLFKHQHLNASPYGFAGVYRQCRCVITVCTRKSPACHKVCNFNKIYCPFFRCNINKDNVHKSIIS